MPVAVKRTQVWLTTLGDWGWPGTASVPELQPPAWIPARPPAPATPAEGVMPLPADGGPSAARIRTRRASLAASLSLLATVLGLLAAGGPRDLERLVAGRAGGVPATATLADSSAADTFAQLPALVPLSSDAAGSAVDRASYASPALGIGGSFFVYLPPGFATETRRYPVVYMLPGYRQPASSFLDIGLQPTLDRLILRGAAAPMIAVVIDGGPGSGGFEHISWNRYESYVLEVQTLIDRMLPTIAQRRARALVGVSMGGYGAMNIALGNPYRYGTVESWLGFFNGLGRQLRADRRVIGALGLHAFVYGADADKIADPAENAPFAAALRGAGADAHSAVYAGEHSLQTVEGHLAHGLAFAGRAMTG